MKYFTLLVPMLMLLGSISVAQPGGRTVTGQIRATGDQRPVEGVTVKVKGTGNVSGSQEDGIYYIVVRSSDSALIFSHPDYETVEIHLTQEAEYNVELKKKHNLSNQIDGAQSQQDSARADTKMSL